MGDGWLAEQRIDRRFPVCFAAEVRTEWQQCAPAEVTDLSRQGVRVEGDRLLVEQVFPNFNPPKGTPRARIEISFDIGQDNGQPAGNITFSCQTIYVRRVAQERYQIGFEFSDIEGSSAELLKSLIDWLSNREWVDD